jgi:hypothetical protein
MTMMEKGILRTAILGFLREKPLSFGELKAQVKVHETALTIAIRDLQNSDLIEHGYLTPEGEWLDDYFPDEGEFRVAWRICK